MVSMTQNTIAVIGTAGRDKTIVMTQRLWVAMVADLKQRINIDDVLVSGGAAWADHLAVHAFLQGWCKSLILFLPAPFESERFNGPNSSSASTANYYHREFKQVTGVDGLNDIAKAISKGCMVLCEPSSDGYQAMFARNKKVASTATACIAYTFGDGDEPADGGTLNTWKQIKSADKVHVPLRTLMPADDLPPRETIQNPSGFEPDAILFCKTNAPYGELSNFYHSPLLGGGKLWPTVEHLYQAQKFTDATIREKIRCLPNPMAAAIEGRNKQNPLRADWERVKEHVMLSCLRLKFTQHHNLAKVLHDTGNRRLVELSYKDSYWGSRPDGSGQNRLGVLLMHIREETHQQKVLPHRIG